MIEAHAAEANPAGARRAWRGWLTPPHGDTGDLGARLTLIALVIALHNLLEAPRDAALRALGPSGPAATGLLAFVALSLSLGLLLLALGERPPTWRWLRSRWARSLALALTLGAGVIGLRQLGVMLATSVQTSYAYPNDGATLDQYAAQQLLAGHNPYVTTDLVAAIHQYQQDPAYTTPLRDGPFAGRAWTDYPSADERRVAFATQPEGDPAAVTGFETRLSYPALAFLPLVPLVWAGLPNGVPLTALCWLGLVALLVMAAPPELRPWVGLLALADVPLLNAAGIADPDLLYLLPLFAAWRWRQRGALSAVTLGLALAAKQLAWFSAPFYAVLIWRERGARAALARLAGAGAVFAAINLPFFINNPRAWLSGVLAPQLDPMFPFGNGLVRLSLSGMLPLAPAPVYTALELLALALALAWYWRTCLRAPALGYALAVAPLFFAWRSLTTYFYFAALPALALLLSHRSNRGAADGPAAVSVREGRTP
ncbi:MAG TPA: hypothetical protein VFQ25_11085 [Ktedonobacterales bacterium]|nr:hypothetical protein [Ktedonobacterales bacterium]